MTLSPVIDVIIKGMWLCISTSLPAGVTLSGPSITIRDPVGKSTRDYQAKENVTTPSFLSLSIANS